MTYFRSLDRQYSDPDAKKRTLVVQREP